MEVKSCTLMENGVALFPDAVILRGRRHMGELAKASREGLRTCVFFVIQRTDAYVFAPNDEADPKLAMLLRKPLRKELSCMTIPRSLRRM